MSKVSVIIPTYNRAEFLHQAIMNVLNQSYQNFEVVVVDDGSKDHTREVVKDFHDKRIQYIRHEINKGEGASRNTGVVNSSGDYIAFLDDDDEWLPEKIAMQVELLEKSARRVGVIYTGCLNVDKNTGKIWSKYTPKYRGNIFGQIVKENFIVISSVILRRECFERVGLFDEKNIPYGLDHDMWIRVSREFEFEYIKEPLVNYCYHHSQITNNLELITRGREALIKKHWTALSNKDRSQSCQRLGVLYGIGGKTQKARSVLLNAIKLYPFSPKNYVGLCLTIGGGNVFRRVARISEKYFFFRK